MLPVSTADTPSSLPIACRSFSLSRTENAEVRADTLRPGTFDSALISVSATPSPKYALARSGLRSAKGSTAMEVVDSALARLLDGGALRVAGSVLGVAIALSRVSRSFALAGRSAGFLARHCSTSALTSRAMPRVPPARSRGASAMCAAMSCAAPVFPANGCAPESSSYATTLHA